VTIEIDDAFISEWHPKYDLTENDETEYNELLGRVAVDIKSRGTISSKTFLGIWKWKGAMRVIRHVKMAQYDTLYAQAFRRVAREPPARKLAILLAPGRKLPGVGAPTGSTILHFIDPQNMPIFDVRTAQVLFNAGILSTGRTDYGRYEEYRLAIEAIRSGHPIWTLRQIDRALFAYHKQYLDKRGQHRKDPARSRSGRLVEGIHRRPGRTADAEMTNHEKFARVFKGRAGETFSTEKIKEMMRAESDIKAGSILPNDHGEGNKGQCSCVGTARQIFDRAGPRALYRVRRYQ